MSVDLHYAVCEMFRFVLCRKALQRV